MNLDACNNKVLRLLNRYSIDGQVSSDSDIQDLKLQIKDLANDAQQFISQIRPIIRYKKITQTGIDSYDIKSYILPDDYRQIQYVKFSNILFYDYCIEDGKIKVPLNYSGIFLLCYIAEPTEIDEDTATDYDFEIDIDAQPAIPYYCAGRIEMEESEPLGKLLMDQYVTIIKNLSKKNKDFTYTIQNINGW